MRLRLMALLATTAALGLGCKAVGGWAGDYGAGMFYATFWTLAAFLVFPRRAAVWRIGVIVFLACCAVEFSQLWQPEFLKTFRASFLGAALIGATFSWLDIPFYALGCAIGSGLKLAVGTPPQAHH